MNPQEALAIIAKLADQVSLPGKDHKILAEAIRVLGEAIKPK